MYSAPRCFIAAMVACAGLSSAARACPECQVASAGMGKDKPTTAPSTMPGDGGDTSGKKGFWSKFNLSMGVDVPSAYIYRGYVQADQGLIVQPFMTLSYSLVDRENLFIRPYVNWTNTLLDTSNGLVKHQHGAAEQTTTKTVNYNDPGHPGNPLPHTHTIQVDGLEGADGVPWYESQVTLGTVIDRGDFTIDLKYHVCLYPDGSHEPIHELGAKLSYDLAGLRDKQPESDRTFSLRASALILREVADQNGPEDTYIELGIEPQWRLKLGGQSIGLSVPIAVALSPDGYFFDSDGQDATFGEWNIGVRASWMLPINERYGRWFLNASCTYYRFLAYSTELSNDGDPNKVVVSVGIGVAF